MGVNETVFPSKKERRHFEHLKDVWAKEYRLFSNLPFLTVFNLRSLKDATDPRNPKPFEVSNEDVRRLKKTSIDYTLCDLDDRPLVCIEFDGISQGYNQAQKYLGGRGANPWRRRITDLKLRIAHGSNFPFFVMGSSHFQVIDSADKLAIVDCVIGAVLSNKEMDRRFSEGFEPQEMGYTEEQFERLSKRAQNAVLEDWCVGVEANSMFTKNPLFKAMWELLLKLDVHRWGQGLVEDPRLNGVSDPKMRSEIIASSTVVGAHAWVELPSGKQFNATVWIPDFKVPGYSPYGFIDDLAVYVALKRAGRKRSKHYPK